MRPARDEIGSDVPLRPYLTNGPTLISFSGGRTSAFMLHEMIRAHGGRLPDNVVVAFANTGKERPETLRFVHECGTRWGVDIRWVEWRRTDIGFEQVGFNSAGREGEPFSALIDWKQRLPNWQERWCTSHLKVLPLHALMRSLGYGEPGEYVETIGLRHDEGLRILKGYERAEREQRRVAYPLAKAKVTKDDVMAFWRSQPFDLALQPWEGNCDLCFLKGRSIKKRIIRDDPARATWWIAEEGVERGNGRGWFDKRDRVAGLVEEVRRSPSLFDDVADDEEYDVECGLHCAAEGAP
jgi:3'-phosphoadenosine 5'-phosphosulfate sulfotransferase (PAPS reductase)/FAD synthetase